jgi:hypothetical protein
LRPDAILAEIARARAVLAEREADVARLTEYIGTLELAAKLADPSLTPTRINRIVSTMNVQAPNLSGDTKRAAGRARRKSEAQRLLYEKDMTVAKLAKLLKVGRPLVSKWFGTAEENRPIPRAIAERLRVEYEIPLSAWARIAE